MNVQVSSAAPPAGTRSHLREPAASLLAALAAAVIMSAAFAVAGWALFADTGPASSCDASIRHFGTANDIFTEATCRTNWQNLQVLAFAALVGGFMVSWFVAWLLVRHTTQGER